MDSYIEYIVLGLAGAVILLLLLIIILMVRVSGLKRRYNKVIGNSSFDHVDDLLISLQEGLAGLSAASKQQADAIEDIRRGMRTMKSKVAVKRYNAFSQQGSDLSFSIAILDDEQDGLVLTGIHGREESYIYAKPVNRGGSSYTLSPEEKEVIAQSSAKRTASAPAGT